MNETISWTDFDAILFDLDGVLTPTAEVHMRAWAEMFNEYLATVPGQAPYTDGDYFAHVDGKPRYDGVRDFLASRAIALPEGTPEDDEHRLTVCGLGNRKNSAFNEVLARDGVEPYPGSLAFLEAMKEDFRFAVVSSSKNAPAVLAAAGLSDYFPVVVDGRVAAAEGIPGKPAPDTFHRAAELLGVSDAASIVVEDAISGVRAGAAGPFGLVIGVDRGVGEEALREAGADVIVQDLGELAARA